MMSCMGTPLIVAGNGGSGGLVLNGVRVFRVKGGLWGPGGIGPIGTPRSYGGNGAAGTVGAVSFSDDPAALKTIPGGVGTVGGTAKGVLLNDGEGREIVLSGRNGQHRGTNERRSNTFG